MSYPANHLRQNARSLARAAIGRRRDWTVPRPRPRRLHGAAWLGPVLMTASVVASWFAFAGTPGEDGGSVALGLFVGAASIILMAWSFLLAVRIRALEPIFGGLDRIYQAHRWAGTLAVLAMFLHVRLEPEVEGGILGASRSVADTAEGLAGVAEYLIYGLVAVSLIRWFPYRFWRLTHKLLGLPFAFASWHFVTAEKPYANNSAWGWYFGSIMAIGLAAWFHRVVIRDMLFRGRSYSVARTELRRDTLEVELAPRRRPIRHRAGQFVVLKVQRQGLSEPHPFTIASSPGSRNLRFFIRDLGDWTRRIQEPDLVGTTVLVEGPYGTFEPLPHDHPGGRPVLWVAGGVGITPFLSAIDELAPAPPGRRPRLVYCVGNRSDGTAMELLEAAARAGRIDLHVFASAEGSRLTTSALADVVSGDGLEGAHVALCGPTGLIATAEGVARSQGATTIESEAFDIRSGIGPDLSEPIEDAIAGLRRSGAIEPATSG